MLFWSRINCLAAHLWFIYHIKTEDQFTSTLGAFDLKQRCAEWSPYDKKAVGSYAFELLSRYFDVIRWSFCSALLQIERAYWKSAEITRQLVCHMIAIMWFAYRGTTCLDSCTHHQQERHISRQFESLMFAVTQSHTHHGLDKISALSRRFDAHHRLY